MGDLTRRIGKKKRPYIKFYKVYMQKAYIQTPNRHIRKCELPIFGAVLCNSCNNHLSWWRNVVDSSDQIRTNLRFCHHLSMLIDRWLPGGEGQRSGSQFAPVLLFQDSGAFHSSWKWCCVQITAGNRELPISIKWSSLEKDQKQIWKWCPC